MKEYKSPEFEEVKYSCGEEVLVVTGEDNAESDLDDLFGP